MEINWSSLDTRDKPEIENVVIQMYVEKKNSKEKE